MATTKKTTTKKTTKTNTTPSQVVLTPPSDAEMKALAKCPSLGQDETMHFRAAPPGYTEVAKTTLSALKEAASDFKLPGVSADVLSQALDTRATLLPIEEKLAPFYRRAYDNRRAADNDGMGVILTLVRAVKSSGDPTLAAMFKPAMDWVNATHTSTAPKKAKKATPAT